MAEGIILKALSGFYYVDDGQQVTACRGRGKLRHEKLTPLVGDRVRFTKLDNGQGALDEILPRKNEFHRPAVANIDQLVIIASEATPVTDPFLIDRVVSIAESRGCDCIICINKCAWNLAISWSAFTGRLAFVPLRSAPRLGQVSKNCARQFPERYVPLPEIPVWENPAF